MKGLRIERRFFLPTLIAVGAAGLLTCGPFSNSAASPSAEQEITLNIGNPAASEDVSLEGPPVVRVDKASEMPIQFYVANNSSKPAGYWKRWLGMSHTWYWQLLDPSTGKQIVERPHTSSAAPTKKDILFLAPGERVLCAINLRDYLGDIPTGLYDFHVYYSIHENGPLAKLGCVPGEFDRTIMLVDVVEGQSIFASLWLWVVAGIVLVVLALYWWHRRRKGGASNGSPCE